MNNTAMQCRYCDALNDPEERRCTRCGRRLNSPAGRPSAESYPPANMAATAPRLEALPGRDVLPMPRAESVSYQPSLFRDVPGGSKVIAIPVLTPRGRESRQTDPEAPELGMPRRSSRGQSGQRRSRSGSQQTLDFHGGPEAAPVDTAIGCDAPVALPLHRSIAAVVDLSMVAIAAGLFLAIFFVSGGSMPFTRQSAPLLIAVLGALTMFYRFLFCIAGGDTPGMRFAGLKLVDFNGRKPDSEQRWIRFAASLLSVITVGLAVFWILIDEEKLHR